MAAAGSYMKKMVSTSIGHSALSLSSSNLPDTSADITAIQPWLARVLIKWHNIFRA